MTEESYWQNVDRGVTGPHTHTCVLASYDRISLRCCIKPETYMLYERMLVYYKQHIGYDALYIPPEFVARKRQLEARYYDELGVVGPRQVRYFLARDPRQLEVIMARLSQGGFRLAVNLAVRGRLHTVGVIRLRPGWYEARSTATPFTDDERVSVEELFAYTEKPVRTRRRPGSSRKTDLEPNIVALPPEPGIRRRQR